MLGEISIDGGLQVGDRVEDAAADALPGHLRKEVLDGVEPGGRGRGEMEGPTRMTRLLDLPGGEPPPFAIRSGIGDQGSGDVVAIASALLDGV